MSDYFQWQNTLSVNVVEMDNEHKNLISLMNKLHDLVLKKASKADLGAALKALGDYTVKHFTDEEAYMERVKHAKVDVHKVIHQQLLKQFTDYAKKFETTGQLNDDFFSFLKVWLTSHIRGIDAQYGSKAKAA